MQSPPARWHLAVGQGVEGPYTREQILTLRARGACDASTLVHRSGWNEWRSLESVAPTLGSDRAPRRTPARGWERVNPERIVARAGLDLSSTWVALSAAISLRLRVLKLQSTELAASVQSAVLTGVTTGVTAFWLAFERIGERLRAHAESLHPEVLLGFAVLGFMTLVGNVIGLILIAVTAPLALQAQAVPGSTGRVSAISIEGLAPRSRACVERAVRNTALPKSRQDNLRVRVPFELERT